MCMCVCVYVCEYVRGFVCFLLLFVCSSLLVVVVLFLPYNSFITNISHFNKR